MTRGGGYINYKVKVDIPLKGYISLKVNVKTQYYVFKNDVGPILNFSCKVSYSSFVQEIGN